MRPFLIPFCKGSFIVDYGLWTMDYGLWIRAMPYMSFVCFGQKVEINDGDKAIGQHDWPRTNGEPIEDKQRTPNEIKNSQSH